MKKLVIAVVCANALLLSGCGRRNYSSFVSSPVSASVPQAAPAPMAGMSAQSTGGTATGNAQYAQVTPETYPQGMSPYGQQGANGMNGAMNGGMNPAMDTGFSTQVISRIQAAGGYSAMKADNAAVDALKSSPMPISQAFANAPLDHRALIIKTLLDGWAGSTEKGFAGQIWATMDTKQQSQLMSQDPILNKLVSSKLKGSFNATNAAYSAAGTARSANIFVSQLGQLIGFKR